MQLVYEPIFAWLHRLDDQWAEFYRLQTVGGQVLELTALHAVYESADCRSTKGRLTFAKDIHVGNCLVLKKEDNITITEVVNITMVSSNRYYHSNRANDPEMETGHLRPVDTIRNDHCKSIAHVVLLESPSANCSSVVL